ncbi:MAG: SurA N-terminal domain-containing protein [Patescibacteria group bacterium]
MDQNPEEALITAVQEQPVENIKKSKIISKKNAIILALVLIVGAAAYTYKGLFIAATVNGSPISRLALIAQLESEAGKAALNAIITQKLIDDEAQKKSITVSDAAINDEIKKIEAQLQTQGQTLASALAAQNLTDKELRSQLTTRKKLEALLADKTQVTDEEIKKFIVDNKVVVPKGQEADYANQIKTKLQQDKFSSAADAFISNLKAQAKINYFVNY